MYRLQVVVPATPYDAKGPMKTALRGRDPVMFIEYKRLYTKPKARCPRVTMPFPLARRDIKRARCDVTIVATGPMAGKALEAAEILALKALRWK